MKKIYLLLPFLMAFGFYAQGQSVTTNNATNIKQTTATLNATASSLNSSKTYYVKFYWEVQGTSISGSSPNASSSTFTGGTSHSFSVDITGLSANTGYHYNAYLYESNFPSDTYIGGGSEVNFTTLAVTTPTVVIGSSITSITQSTAACDGNNITDNGGASVTAYGICWNTTGSPTTADSKHEVGTGDPGTSNWNGSLTSLSTGTHYYVRAYATNSQGTSYSSTTRDFYTNTDNPIVAAETNVTDVAFDANWNATTGAEGYKLDVSTASDFSTHLSGYPKDVNNVTTYTVSGLTANTNYYYRVLAYNNVSTDGAYWESGYSATNGVKTLVAAPTVQATDLKWETVNGAMRLNWTNGNGSARIVVMKDGGAVTDPAGGSTYSADAAFGLGDQIGSSGTYVVYNGSAKGTVDVTNLQSGHDYYFKVLEYNGTGSTTNYNTSSTTGWTGNEGNSGLPITLASFDAKTVTEGVKLEWKTASEINNNYFVVQRSVNGSDFEDLKQVLGAGNSNVVNFYDYIDKNAPKGVVYYRLKQVDYDGASTLSNVIYVDTKAASGSVTINKVVSKDNALDIYVNKTNNTRSVLSLYDMDGKLVQGVILGQKGGRVINLDMSGNSHGFYFIKIQTQDNIVSRKVIY